MKKEILEVKEAIYTGMCIYDTFKSTIVEIEGKFVSLDDKKYLSLYLGILNTNNKVSNMIKDTELMLNTKVNFKRLDNEEYINIYKKYFKNILIDLSTNSIDEYFSSLLYKEIIIKLNREYNFSTDVFVNYENKQLVKK